MKHALKTLWQHTIIFCSMIGGELKNLANISLGITKAILSFANNPIADFALNAILPEEIAKKLPDIKQILSTSINLLYGLTDNNPLNDDETIKQFIASFIGMTELQRNALAQKLSAIILSVLHKSKLKENEYQSIIDALLHYKKYS